MFTSSVKKITSLENESVKHWVRLKSDRAYRLEHGLALVSSEDLLRELSGLVSMEAIIALDPSLAQGFKAPHIYIVTEAIMKKVLALPSPPPIAALVRIPPPSSLTNFSYILALDTVADPGNLGTLARTALALGWQAIALMNQSTDLFHDRAIRASKGASFLVPYAKTCPEELLRLSQARGLPIYLADLEGEEVRGVEERGGAILVLGSEARGLQEKTKELLAHGARALRISSAAAMPSLNVAIAGAILMHELKDNG